MRLWGESFKKDSAGRKGTEWRSLWGDPGCLVAGGGVQGSLAELHRMAASAVEGRTPPAAATLAVGTLTTVSGSTSIPTTRLAGTLGTHSVMTPVLCSTIFAVLWGWLVIHSTTRAAAPLLED